MFDYPHCKQIAIADDDDATETEDATGDVWECYLFMPTRDAQGEGDPAMVTPSVVTGYYVSSFIPGQQLLSYAKSEQLMKEAYMIDYHVWVNWLISMHIDPISLRTRRAKLVLGLVLALQEHLTANQKNKCKERSLIS